MSSEKREKDTCKSNGKQVVRGVHQSATEKSLSTTGRCRYRNFPAVTKSKRKWSDRIKWVEEPLIKSYIFVKVKPIEFPIVFRTPELSGSSLLKVGPFPFRSQINNLRLLVDSDAEIDVTSENSKKGTILRLLPVHWRD